MILNIMCIMKYFENQVFFSQSHVVKSEGNMRCRWMALIPCVRFRPRRLLLLCHRLRGNAHLE